MFKMGLKIFKIRLRDLIGIVIMLQPTLGRAKAVFDLWNEPDNAQFLWSATRSFNHWEGKNLKAWESSHRVGAFRIGRLTVTWLVAPSA